MVDKMQESFEKIPFYPFKERAKDHLENTKSLNLFEVKPGDLITVQLANPEVGKKKSPDQLKLQIKVISPAKEGSPMRALIKGGQFDKEYEAKVWGVFLTPFSPAVRQDYLDTNAYLNLRIFDPEYRRQLKKQLKETEEVILGTGVNSIKYPYMFADHRWPKGCDTYDKRLSYLDEIYGEKIGWRSIDPSELLVKDFKLGKNI